MTKTTIVSVGLNYEGTNYLKEKTFDADLNMKMNLPDSKYTFSDNSLTLGALSVGLNGDVILPADADMVLDIEFQSLDMSIKSILSLLPGNYSSYLENVSADGEVGIEGKVSGVYNESRLPDININAMISNGYLAYEEYPIPIERDSIGSCFTHTRRQYGFDCLFQCLTFRCRSRAKISRPKWSLKFSKLYLGFECQRRT